MAEVAVDKRGTASKLIADVAQSPDRAGELALEFVLERVRGGTLSTEALQRLKAALPDVAVAITREAFATQYGIKVLGESQVALTLPKDTSRLAFLQEAQALVRKLNNRDLIWPSSLKIWESDPMLTSNIKNELKLAVDGNVGYSTKMTRREQEKAGWLDVDMIDLALAHAAYFVVTGEDLFANNWVRARGGTFYFFSTGLSVDDSYGDYRRDIVSASRALPFPN